MIFLVNYTIAGIIFTCQMSEISQHLCIILFLYAIMCSKISITLLYTYKSFETWIKCVRKKLYTNSPGPICGVKIIDEKDFTFPTQGNIFEWEKYGFCLDFSKSNLPPSMGECRINIRVSLSGQFQLPEDSDLLSPVFWISAPCKFAKPVMLEIQHCALTDEATLSQLSFVSVKCSQRDLPYRFTGWMEECSPHTVPSVTSSWATSLGLESLGERTPHDFTVHMYTGLWSGCMTGDSTLLSHKISMQTLWYSYFFHL